VALAATVLLEAEIRPTVVPDAKVIVAISTAFLWIATTNGSVAGALSFACAFTKSNVAEYFRYKPFNN
jgi:hypothetical protein